ncbi:hypothetical protein GCM10009559_13660 [Pseudonocardia zijingensis]|uniref:ATP-grasp target RiPP n=1 Tax=Pseudonocardia zijingensis TaxID=153376 RepID=A0ABP3ZWY2_9PSEU
MGRDRRAERQGEGRGGTPHDPPEHRGHPRAATVWHNDGKGDSTIDENISGMEAQIEPIESMRYDITQQFSSPANSSSNTS